MAQRRVQNKEPTPCLYVPCPKESYIFKVVLLGSTAVGKSSLAYRYVKKDFRDSLPTVGCSFFTQVLSLDNTTIKLEIWDTAGQEKYHSVCHLYYRGANAAVLVYDITRKESLEKAKVWLTELEKEFLPDEIIIALVGNKLDLSAEREVTLQIRCFSRRQRILHRQRTCSTWKHLQNLITKWQNSSCLWLMNC
ncbi:ras-related protein Rab-17 isoform X2 [Zootoca vivipara]|uniref:ras-related protein Rab-17 isoform X2 n=1 Tax=Zootoca vivipara TaxID=8524 RepID=UPI0015902890|nr:ras-related protein Rab-17 isoform X2 [Zootoca vivipara]